MTPAAVDSEKPTHEELRPTRLESRCYLRCDPDPQALNMRQAGVPYSEFETHLQTKQGAPESSPLGNTWAQDGSLTLSWKHPAENRPQADTETW